MKNLKALHSNGRCPFCRYRLKLEELVRCPWLDDVRNMAEKAGESLRKCETHTDQLMTHFDVDKKRPACKKCADNNESIWTLEAAKSKKKDDILKVEFTSLGKNQIFMENFRKLMKLNAKRKFFGRIRW